MRVPKLARLLPAQDPARPRGVAVQLRRFHELVQLLPHLLVQRLEFPLEDHHVVALREKAEAPQCGAEWATVLGPRGERIELRHEVGHFNQAIPDSLQPRLRLAVLLHPLNGPLHLLKRLSHPPGPLRQVPRSVHPLPQGQDRGHHPCRQVHRHHHRVHAPPPNPPPPPLPLRPGAPPAPSPSPSLLPQRRPPGGALEGSVWWSGRRFQGRRASKAY